MAIGTQGKINELMGCNKTDLSIQNEYNKISREFSKEKQIFKTSKEEYKIAKEQLEIAKENFIRAPFKDTFQANRKVKITKRRLKQARQKYILDRQKYKQKLKELREIRREIRSQYKSHRQYAKFFKKVQEAQKMGISLPRYITDEYAKQKSTYLSEKYNIDANGKKNYITPPNTNCTKDVSTLIWEKNKENIKDNLQKVTEKVQSLTAKKEQGNER